MIGVVIFLIYFFFFSKNQQKDLQSVQSFGQNVMLVQGHKIKVKKHRKRNKHEERCREIFEEIFGTKFRSIRPNWLKNPLTGSNLELDGFSPLIKTKYGTGLAFEYDGAQHSSYNKFFHNSPKDFIYQVKKDSWKDKRCKEMGILLIRIPSFVAYQDLERYIRQQLRRELML